MTPRQLRQALHQIPEELQDNHDVSIKVGDEYYPLTGIVLDDPGAEGILDENSVVLLCSASDIKNISHSTWSMLYGRFKR